MSDDERPRTLLEIKDGHAPRGTQMSALRDTLLDTYGKNFMGSGLGFADYLSTMDVLRYERWHGTQVREERQRRMQYLIELCAEQKRLVDESIQATGMSQRMIEALIEGDWVTVHMWIERLRFDEREAEYCSIQRARFARFCEIAQGAYDTRPRVFCPLCRKPTPERALHGHYDRRHICPWCDVVHDGATAEDRRSAKLSAVKDEPDAQNEP